MNGMLTVLYPDGNKQVEKLFKNGFWTGDEYRAYRANGKLAIEIAKDSFGMHYYNVDADGKKTAMTEEEKTKLLDRIDMPYLRDKNAEEIEALAAKVLSE